MSRFLHSTTMLTDTNTYGNIRIIIQINIKTRLAIIRSLTLSLVLMHITIILVNTKINMKTK